MPSCVWISGTALLETSTDCDREGGGGPRGVGRVAIKGLSGMQLGEMSADLTCGLLCNQGAQLGANLDLTTGVNSCEQQDSGHASRNPLGSV